MFELKKLGGLVNSSKDFPIFLEYLQSELDKLHKSYESITDPVEIYRIQGEIRRIRKLLMLRDYVNARKNR